MYTANGKYFIKENFSQKNILSKKGSVINIDEAKQVENTIPFDGSNYKTKSSIEIETITSPINQFSKHWSYGTEIKYCINNKCFTENEIKKLLELKNKKCNKD
jgi:hypothetical protein